MGEAKKNSEKENKTPDANLSHRELTERLDLYSKVGNGDKEKQFFEQQHIKIEYQKEVDKRTSNRTIGEIYYAQGKRSGLNQNSPEQIKDMQARQDQKLRNEVYKESKKKYDQTNSLNKYFKEIEKN